MKKLVISFTIIISLFTSCLQEDYFGLSPYGNIKTIEISNQASQAVIDADTYEVSVEFPGGVNLTQLEIKTLSLSSFAKSDKNVGDTINLNQTQELMVTAEDGSITTWTITAFVASATPQLPNSDFNVWYQTSGGYFEPGADEVSTIWGTGNAGTQVLNLLATTPIEVSDGNYAAKMETLDNGKLAAGFGTPISAGSIFTGVFDKDNIDPSDPQAAIDFGTPFAGRPLKFILSYQYQTGETNKDKDGNELPDGDQLDIYVLLEIRSNNRTERLATAWFRSGDEQTETASTEVEFVYSELDASYPDYMQPTDGGFVSADSATYALPTHITFVASSSFDGANFAGAIGSTLVIDDFVLIYEE